MPAAPATQKRTPRPDGQALPPHKSYIQVIKTYVFQLSKGRLSGDKQLFAILHIAAETLGKSRAPGSPPPDYASLTVAQIARAAGCSVRLAYPVLADAAKRGLIEVLDAKQAKEHGMPAASHPQAKWYRICAENWAKAPKYEPPKLTVVEEPAVEEDGEPEAETPSKPWGKGVALKPGQRSRAFPLAPEAKKFAVACDGSVPVRVDPSLDDHGVLTFRIRDGQTKSETPVKPTSRVTDIRSAPAVGSKALVQLEIDLFGVVNPASLRYVHRPADSSLVRRIAEVLGDCPVEWFTAALEKRLKRVTGNLDSAGLFIKVAEDCRAGWDSEADFRRQEEQSQEAGRAAYEARLRAEFEACPERYRLSYEAPLAEFGTNTAWFDALDAHAAACPRCKAHAERSRGVA